MNSGPSPAVAIVLALGITLGGWLAGQGFVQGRRADRFVTVKGVAERVVTADVALWPLNFVSSDDALASAQARIEAQRRAVLAFLARHGIDSALTEIQALDVADTRANPYYGGTPAANRYIVSMSMMVRSEEPAKIQAASQRVSELVDAGVVLGASPHRGPQGGPTYLFTKLNDLKPPMIAEATASARQAAEQFAKDARSRLGPIRRANQGVFEILPRDPAPGVMEGNQVQKTLRVVTTVEYQL